MNVKILGVDVGNDYTKSSKGVVFRTSINHGSDKFRGTGCHVVEFKNSKYTIGSDFEYIKPTIIAFNKNVLHLYVYDNDLYRLSLLTAIALSFPDEEEIIVKLVIGLPILYYDLFKDKAIESIMNLNEQIIIIDGIKKTIIIEDCLAIQQSYITLVNPEKYRNLDTLIIDIGGLNVNVSRWEYQNRLAIKRQDSFEEGYYENVVYRVDRMIKINRIDRKLGLGDILNMIDEGRINVYEEVIDVSTQINIILEEYVDLLIRKIDYRFSPQGCDQIILTGGGAKSLYKYLKKVYPIIKVGDNHQLSNALAFNAFGQMSY